MWLASEPNQQIEVTKLFIEAIDAAGLYTRAIHTITRTYGANVAQPGAASLVLVNADGWALTCKHVAQQLMATDEVNSRYASFQQALAAKPDKKSLKAHRKALQSEYGYRSDTVIEIRHMLMNCGNFKGFEIKLHPTMDMALMRFNDFTELPGTQYPVFAADGGDLKPGMSLCRLGFPFPEFQNFEYDADEDTIRWTQSGRQDSPRFPIDGMVTRHLTDSTGVVGFELSTPGLKGQSGGPAFDEKGRVWGIQAATKHLDLDFDIDQQVLRGGTKKRIQDHAFLHVGHCLHIDAIKAFMSTHDVHFIEG